MSLSAACGLVRERLWQPEDLTSVCSVARANTEIRPVFGLARPFHPLYVGYSPWGGIGSKRLGLMATLEIAKALDATVLADPAGLHSFDRLHLVDSLGSSSAVCADYEAIGMQHGCTVLAYSTEDANLLYIEASRLMTYTVCPPTGVESQDDCLPLHEVFGDSWHLVAASANAVTEACMQTRTHARTWPNMHAGMSARSHVHSLADWQADGDGQATNGLAD